MKLSLIITRLLNIQQICCIMTFKSRSSTITLPSDVVFEPYSEMRTQEGTDTLVIHIPEFRKDQLRVQVNNLGVLKASGEKPLGEDGKRKTRFVKEAKIPQGCDINHIRAKFVAGHLHVIMPIKAPSPSPPDKQQEQPPKTSSTTQAEAPESNALVFDEQKLEASSRRNGVMSSSTSKDEARDHGFGIGNSLARFQIQKKVSVNLGVAVVALVAIGAYVAYTYGSSSSSSSSSPPSQIED